jgi:hypothetical protein
VFNGRLYAGATDGSLQRLNLEGNDWEQVCPKLNSWSDPITAMVVFNNNIYAYQVYQGLLKINESGNAWEPVVSSSIEGTNNLCVFNNLLYADGSLSGGDYSLFRLSIDQTIWQQVCSLESPWEPGQTWGPGQNAISKGTMSVYNDMLYWITSRVIYHYEGGFWTSFGCDVRRLNSSETTFEIMTGLAADNQAGRALVIVDNKLYFSIECQSRLYKYETIVSLDFTSDKLFDIAPAEIQFSSTSTCDFPSLLTYSWDFGDGLTSIEQNPTHTFIHGTYSITLVLDDTISTATLSKYNFVDSYIESNINIDTIQKLQSIGTPGNALSMVEGLALHDNYVQTVSIDASETSSWNGGLGFKPISPATFSPESPAENLTYNRFGGSYNGNSHPITNLYINRPLEYGVGLFDTCNSATFTDINLQNANMSGLYASSICCISENSTFSGCSSTCTIMSNNNVGGILCRGDMTTLQNCHSEVDISSAGSEIGGLAGYLSGSISGCYSSGTIQSTIPDSIGVSMCGGLIGNFYCSSIAENSYSTCSILYVYSQTGGLFGVLQGPTQTQINNCYATGDITTCDVDTLSISIGAFAGVLNGDFEVHNCYASGNIIALAKPYFVGGFCGESYTRLIENCHSSGSVVGYSYVGGFIGYSTGFNSEIDAGTISNCYSTSNVTIESFHNADSDNIGGFAGYIEISCTDCHATGNILFVSGTGNYVGGFAGDFRVNALSLRNYYFGNINVQNMNYVGGFVGNLVGLEQEDVRLEQCFAMRELTASGVFCGGFAGASNCNCIDCFSQMNVNYQHASAGMDTYQTLCQTATNPFCADIAALSTSYETTFSQTGMNIRVLQTGENTFYATPTWPTYDYFNNKEFKLHLDFTPKGTVISTGESYLQYGIFEYSTIKLGIKITVFGIDHPEHPDEMQITIYQVGVSEKVVYSESHVFDTLFSIIYERLGCTSNIYINSALVDTINGYETNFTATTGGPYLVLHDAGAIVVPVNEYTLFATPNEAYADGFYWGQFTYDPSWYTASFASGVTITATPYFPEGYTWGVTGDIAYWYQIDYVRDYDVTIEVTILDAGFTTKNDFIRYGVFGSTIYMLLWDATSLDVYLGPTTGYPLLHTDANPIGKTYLVRFARVGTEASLYLNGNLIWTGAYTDYANQNFFPDITFNGHSQDGHSTQWKMTRLEINTFREDTNVNASEWDIHKLGLETKAIYASKKTGGFAGEINSGNTIQHARCYSTGRITEL